MLVLGRKLGEGIVVGTQVQITLSTDKRGRFCLSIQAPGFQIQRVGNHYLIGSEIWASLVHVHRNKGTARVGIHAPGLTILREELLSTDSLDYVMAAEAEVDF